MFNTPTEIDAALQALGAVACVKGGVSFIGLLDAPDLLLEQGAGPPVRTRQFDLTFRSSAVTLAPRDAVTVAGVAYSVRDWPRQQDDGALSIVRLSQV